MTKNQKAEHIAIIGAGVSGITTGILLQEHGFEVTIYAEQEFSKNLINPKFASLYPAASIIPHSVSHYDLIRLFKESQQFFNHLYEQKFLGITKHRHFELFSYRINKPDYLIGMHNVNKVSEEEWTPSHPSITTPNGWAYDCFFTDWNTYFNQLIQLFKRNNGSIIKRKVDLNLLNNINHNIIINCSGAGSNDLLEETNTPLIVLGHLLKIKTSKPMNSPLSKPISYNFSPGIDIYKNYTNDPLDVYFYPRSTDWVLGGSRFIGTLDENGQWAPDSATSDVFPREILDLNKEILKTTL